MKHQLNVLTHVLHRPVETATKSGHSLACKPNSPMVKDAYGTLLQDGDMVTLIKDLKVKINRLMDGDHNIDCKITGIGAMMLKSEFVKKA